MTKLRGFDARLAAARGNATDCWPWASVRRDGYGRAYLDGRHQLAHRAVYERLVGPVPEGKELDHLCRNRRCVNPAHLEPVTRRVNVLRGVSPAALAAQQTHCLNGHPFVEGSFFARPGRNERICRECHAASAKSAHLKRYRVCKRGHQLPDPAPGHTQRSCATCKALGLHRHSQRVTP